jgi:NTP pyrophosphatase (non-canonical NTP hydrolase)
MPVLKENPTLADFQKYIKEVGIERGWNKNDQLKIFLLFMEEIGELAKAIRNKMRLYTEKNKKIDDFELEGEFADVFNYFIDLANIMNIDLEPAIRKKEEQNAKRHWDENLK